MIMQLRSHAFFAMQARVEAAGGQILFWNGVRVMGVLAVSRAIGDHCLRPFVIAQPEVRT
jgi:protein phosphatase 2C